MYHLHRYWRCTSSELDGVSIIVILYLSNRLWHGTLATYCYKTDVKTFCTDISDKQTFTCTIRLELCRLPYKVRKSKQQIPMLLRINFFSPKTKTNFKSCTNQKHLKFFHVEIIISTRLQILLGYDVQIKFCKLVFDLIIVSGWSDHSLKNENKNWLVIKILLETQITSATQV